jgi:methylated-DNA-protein-cysteine methyltransferase-like protein
MGASSDPDVPWHRVLNAQGRISAAERRVESGLQRDLLKEEGIVFDEEGRVDLAAYQWEAPPDVADRLASH